MPFFNQPQLDQPQLSTTSAPLRVASVPSQHPYVRHLSDPERDDVLRLPDPPPIGGAADRWWPPAMLTPRWIAANTDAFDVMHVHFGMESFSNAELAAALDALRSAGRPLVYTAHDLTNPQLHDQTRHLEQVALMAERADELITLTEGAADAIHGAFGRRPTVITHPHMQALHDDPPTGVDRGVAIGVHLRDLRPNINGPGTVRMLADASSVLAGRGREIVGRVELNDRVRDERARDAVREIVAAAPRLTLREHARSTDAELARDLADLHAALLPYRHGTHSGWVELCFDLGVPTVGTGVGFMHEQHPGDSLRYRSGDAVSLADAIEAALDGPATAPGSEGRLDVVRHRRHARRRQLSTSAAAHRRVYERALR